MQDRSGEQQAGGERPTQGGGGRIGAWIAGALALTLLGGAALLSAALMSGHSEDAEGADIASPGWLGQGPRGAAQAPAEPLEVATPEPTASPAASDDWSGEAAEMEEAPGLFAEPSEGALGVMRAEAPDQASAGASVGSGYGRGAAGFSMGGSEPAPRASRRIVGARPAPNRVGRGSPASVRTAPTPGLAARPLPQNGVLASNFVGGHGVQARLSDLLDRGVMVDGENVRLEAFGERGRLPYAVPSREAVAMHADLERTRVQAAGDVVHLQVALLARQGEAPPRPRMDIRLVLDRSGSMQDGSKWNHAIQAAHALVRALRPGDSLGIISYSDQATLDLAPTRLGDGQAAHRAIDRLGPGGGTNIGDALALAKSHMPRRRSPGDVALVVLVSDGQATTGITDPRALGAVARSMFDADGVLTTSVGLGTDFDEETMLTVAREGSGSYHFVRRPADIAEILEDELEDRAQAVAQALRLRVVLSDGVVARRVYGSRMLSEQEHAAVRAPEVASDQRIARELGITSDRARENEEGLRIHLPSFRRGDQHVVLMELSVPRGRAGSRAGIARVFLEYKDLVNGSNGEAHASVTAERVSERSESVASVRRPVKRTVLAFQAGEALQLAADALGSGDARQASEMLAERRELLEAAADVWRDPSLREDAGLLRRYERVLASAWPSWGHGERRTLVMAMNYYGDQRMR